LGGRWGGVEVVKAFICVGRGVAKGV